MEKPVYVIGHRNPDTDSICSAIGYAHLKQELGTNAVPARAGKVNSETKFILEYFGVQPPQLISDLYPRVRDVMIRDVPVLQPYNTLRKLGKLMKQQHVKSVPVVDSAMMLQGIVSVGDLANRYFDELEMQDFRYSGVTFAGILRVLEGTLLCGTMMEQTIPGTVRIAGAHVDTLNKVLEPEDILIVADRNNVHELAVRRPIACLILTGGAQPSPAVLAEAAETGIKIIQTNYTTYTCARLINQSIPVRMIMQTSVVAFKPSDMINDIKSTIIRTNHRNYPVVENGKLLGIINRDQLIVPEKEKIILVDHNEHTQAVEGIEEARILEIIDHHRLGGLETSEPIFIRHEPVGCTATIVANMHWHRNIAIPKTIAGLLLSAIISDTALFKSPTCTARDVDTAERLAMIAELDIQEYGVKLLRAGSKIGEMGAAEIVHYDLKEFQTGEYRMSISQLSVMEPDEALAKQTAIKDYLIAMRRKEGFDMAILMVTDIIAEATHLIYAGQPISLLEQAFGSAGQDGLLYLPGVMSRKKQVLPPLVEAARLLDQ